MMNSKLNVIAIIGTLTSLGAFNAFAAGNQWMVDLGAGSGTVEFNATGRPSALVINGKGAAPKGKVAVNGTSVTGSANFDLTSLDTGINLRNDHMKNKYLEVSKYPQATLTIQKLTLPS